MKNPSKKLSALIAPALASMACAGTAQVSVTPQVTSDQTSNTKNSASPAQDSASAPMQESELQAKINYLPGYEIRRKIAVVLNGSTESWATKAVTEQIQALQEKGFDKLLVASNQPIPESEKLVVVPGNTEGFDTLFSSLSADKELKEKDLLYVQVGGHGSIRNGESCIAIEGEPCYTQEHLFEKLEFLKQVRARLLFFSGGCHSGSYPAAFDKAGFTGAFMSAGGEGEVASSEFDGAFTRFFGEGYDHNGDGISEPSDWFGGALAHSRLFDPKIKTNGRYTETHPELTLANLDTILQLNKKIILQLTMPGCQPCDDLEILLRNISQENGRETKVVTLTSGNPELDEILKHLGISEKVEGFPKVYIREAGAKEFVLEKGYYFAENFVTPKTIVQEIDALVESKRNESERSGKPSDEEGIAVRNLLGIRSFAAGEYGAGGLGAHFEFSLPGSLRNFARIGGVAEKICLKAEEKEESGVSEESECQWSEWSGAVPAEIGVSYMLFNTSLLFERQFNPGITNAGLLFGFGNEGSKGPLNFSFKLGPGLQRVDDQKEWNVVGMGTFSLQFATPYFGEGYGSTNKWLPF